ncbi:hypothetical protein N7532_000571 [Penicillium argentinense]|uniref:ACB domain-containing protein n=1 Tax=Penicillium argentinense TaxID=1131581 RepID=A0A9W9G5K9_9EURO|nr:uncharacterized protein N7532_000571 [Penicillium argentinense]KAJ5112526.1 hypothetical protein N7532_000571 [Penicillium argentinense]
MADLTTFVTALEAAQNGAKYNPDIQAAAKKVNTDDFKKAYAAAEAMGAKDTISDEAQSTALVNAFEFAALLVKELEAAPTNDEKLDLYAHFKIGKREEVPKPGMFDMVKKAMFNHWSKYKDELDAQKAQATYVKLVVGLIAKYGLRD